MIKTRAVSVSICSTCGERLNVNGVCTVCLVRAGLSPRPTTEFGPADASRFGDFEIAQRDDGSDWELGRGAMGVTYRALDTVLHRTVALKVIDLPAGGDASWTVRERFLREARAAASLRHANVAGVFQFGALPNTTRCYYAMELVEGETLDARVRRDGPLKLDLALTIAIQITRALMAAAHHGLIHRDLKPGNIMLTGGEAADEVEAKIIDFGLARATADAAGEMDLTHGAFVGTPTFASPEQFDRRELDPRSDIYSLGVTLWYALTGLVPRPGRTIEEIRDRQAHAALPVEQLVAKKVPYPLIALLRRTLAENPADRPAAARELLEALESCRAKVIRSRFRSLNRLAALLLIIAVIAAAVLAVPLLQKSKSPAFNGTPRQLEKSVAVLPFDDLSNEKGNAFFADGIQDDVLSSLAKIADLKVIGRHSVMSYRGSATHNNLPDIGRALGVTNLVEGSVQRTGDRVRVSVRLIDARTERQLWAESYDRAIADSLTLQGELAREIAGAMRVALSPEEKAQIETKPTQNGEAYMLYLRGLASSSGSRTSASRSATDMSVAVKCFEDAVKLDPNFALAWAKLSRSLGWLYPNYGAAAQQKDAIRQAAETAARLQPDAEETALAQAYYELWVKLDYAAARAHFERARRIAPNNGEALAGLADVAQAQGRWSEYLPLVRESRRLDPRNPELWAVEARFLRWTKQYAAADHALDEALAITPDHAGLISQKAILFQVQGDLQNSRAWLSRRQVKLSDPESIRVEDTQWLMERRPELAVHAWQTVLGNPDADRGIVEWQRYFLGRAQLLARDATGARTTWLQARTEMEVQVKEDPANAQCVMQLGRIYAGLGEKAAALREGEHALQLLGTRDASRRVNLETVFAQLSADAGEKDGAMDVIERLVTVPGGPTLAELRLHPAWDPLREHPRFQKLLAGPEPKTIY
jgi:serine/threonine protein kinase/cytochrome c-type biogenesis protein CcmH/NrfG